MGPLNAVDAVVGSRPGSIHGQGESEVLSTDLRPWEMLICHLCILLLAVRGHRVAWYPTGLGVL